MVIKYFEAPDIKALILEIVDVLELLHVKTQSIHCLRSYGSKSRYTIARIHGLGKIWQKTFHISPSYIIEVISERYDSLSEEKKIKVLIHELLHVPRGFSGGFRPHKGYVNEKKVEKLYSEMQKKKKENAKRPKNKYVHVKD